MSDDARSGGPRREAPRPAWRGEGAARLLRLLAERVESYLDGDEMAFETLGEAIEEIEPSGDDLETTVLALRGAASASAAEAGEGSPDALESAPGRQAQRVWSREERESLSPEAWGYLIDLKGRGSIDDAQFERVLDVLIGSGVRPVGVDLAREVAARVALDAESTGRLEGAHGEFEQTH